MQTLMGIPHCAVLLRTWWELVVDCHSFLCVNLIHLHHSNLPRVGLGIRGQELVERMKPSVSLNLLLPVSSDLEALQTDVPSQVSQKPRILNRVFEPSWCIKQVSELQSPMMQIKSDCSWLLIAIARPLKVPTSLLQHICRLNENGCWMEDLRILHLIPKS